MPRSAPRPCPDDPTSDLVAQVQHHSRSVIEAEMQRLARRVSALRQADLDVIDAALNELADSLILNRLRNVPSDTAPLLRRLFDTQRLPQ